jgi:thiol:disulfide interchange protein DsbD
MNKKTYGIPSIYMRIMGLFYLLSYTTVYAEGSSWSSHISTLIQTTDSLALKLFFVLILGLLLSLTPCIYPMIPITVGILQAQGSSSLLRNLSLALAYTMGIATTFATLGLIAAFTGNLFGSLMYNPLVILPLVALLAYLAFAMMGFYEMYTPKLFTQNNAARGGSLCGAFLFGAASGTVASPCLSPGLILVLSIVTALGNKLLGFLMLFTFGVGLSIPLLIIGTFSSSLNVLPKAGMWMVEIKKMFGLLLLGMCFYFLHFIIPTYIVLWTALISISILAPVYLRAAQRSSTTTCKVINYATYGILLAALCGTGSHVYKATWNRSDINHNTHWVANYTDALEQAHAHNKYLFVDVTAPYCSICSAIEEKLFTKNDVSEILQQLVPVQIDSSNTSQADNAAILKKFEVLGVPTFLVVDPKTETIVKRWGGELYDTSAETFIAELSPYTHA